MNELITYREKVNKHLTTYNHAKQQVRDETLTLEKAKKYLLDVGKAQAILQGIAQQMQQRAHAQVAGIVSRCLAAVFDDPYEFKFIFEKKRGKTEARPVFIRDGQEYDPRDNIAVELGAIDVAAFALRVASMMLAKPRTRRILILDEPFRFLHKRKMRKVRGMLWMLAKEMKIQFIIVTHEKGLRMGTVVDLEKPQ